MPDSTSAAPIQKSVGDTIPLDISVDPGKNLVTYLKLEIQYDPEVLATDSASAFQANTTAFPLVLEGPIYSPGKIAVTLSIGNDVTKAIQAKAKAATVTFKALKDTPPGTPTQVTYGISPKTQVLSMGGNDQYSEDVLSSAAPAVIAIGGGILPSQGIPTGSPVPTIEMPSLPPQETPVPPQPTNAPPISYPTDVPYPTPTTVVPTNGPGGPGTPNTLPVCNSLVTDRAINGNVPFSLTFTANGSDTDGTISKVTMNYGDGQQNDITAAGGIGTASVNVQSSHTYNNPGTYRASAVLTDSSGGMSTINDNCQQIITVSATASAQRQNTQTGNPGGIAATGSFENSLAIGATVLMLIIGGGLMFFIL